MRASFTLRTLFWIAALLAVALAAYKAGCQQGEHERAQLRSEAQWKEWTVTEPIDIQLRVIDAESQNPIKGVRVEMTLVSGWGDGGYTDYVTDADGSFTTNESLCVGNYQIEIHPPENSDYAGAYFHSTDDMLNIKKNGTYSPSTFLLTHKRNSNNSAE